MANFLDPNNYIYRKNEPVTETQPYYYTSLIRPKAPFIDYLKEATDSYYDGPFDERYEDVIIGEIHLIIFPFVRIRKCSAQSTSTTDEIYLQDSQIVFTLNECYIGSFVNTSENYHHIGSRIQRTICDEVINPELVYLTNYNGTVDSSIAGKIINRYTDDRINQYPSNMNYGTYPEKWGDMYQPFTENGFADQILSFYKEGFRVAINTHSDYFVSIYLIEFISKTNFLDSKKKYTNSTWNTSKTWYIKVTFKKQSSNVVNYVTMIRNNQYKNVA